MKKIYQLLSLVGLLATILFGFCLCVKSKDKDAVVVQVKRAVEPEHCKYGKDSVGACNMSPAHTQEVEVGIEIGEDVVDVLN